jgi:hypothetical protein
VICLGGVYGGPELRGSRIDRAIGQLVKLRGPGVEGRSGSLDLAFHIPGSVFAPKFAGIRTGRLSKKERMLAIQISVPPEVVFAEDADIQSFLVRAIRDSIDLAAESFHLAGIPYPHDDYLALIDRVEQGLLQ